MKPCTACLKACPKGLEIPVFDKKGVCRQFPLKVENPDNDTLEYVKELMEYRKGLIGTGNISPLFFRIT